MDTKVEQQMQTAALACPTRGETREARASLRAQIVRLERRLGLLAYELGAAGRSLPLPSAAATALTTEPRLPTLGELEVTRDRLVGQIATAEAVLARAASSEADARGRLEAMLVEPAAHRFELVHQTELGVPGCGAYHVRPRLGLLGMLFGWWCVKLSSGCP